MRRTAALWVVLATFLFSSSAAAQTTPPEATVPPVPTEREVMEPTAPPPEEPAEATEAPAPEPAVPDAEPEDDTGEDGGLSSNAIAFLILGAVVLALVIFGIAISQRRPGDPRV